MAGGESPPCLEGADEAGDKKTRCWRKGWGLRSHSLFWEMNDGGGVCVKNQN